jgi:precorrin-6B methylase 2
MKRETMVYIMAIRLTMGTRLVDIGAGSGCLRKIKITILPMWPTKPPTLIFSPRLIM